MSFFDPDKFGERYRVSSVRLQNWNYGWNGDYFVTLCARDRECFFGKIYAGEMRLSYIGILAKKYWREIPDHFPFVHLGPFVIMPNHVHGIIKIRKPAWYFVDDHMDGSSTRNKNPGITDFSDDMGNHIGIVETRHCLVLSLHFPISITTLRILNFPDRYILS